MSEKQALAYSSKEGSSFLIRYFEDFYCEILRQRERVLTPDDALEQEEPASQPEETSQEQPETAPTKETLAQTIQETLTQLLNSQSVDTTRFGGDYAVREYKEAEFIMVALADEVFLHMDWSGKEYWENNLLESQLYQSHMAGEEFFDRIETFLKARDPSRADIGMLYLLALGLGFQGKYRGLQDQKALDHYRHELFSFVYRRDPSLYEKEGTLFPDAYLHTVEEGKPIYLNEFRPWIIMFGIASACLLTVSYAVWRWHTHEIYGLTKNIIAIAMSAP